MKILHKAATIFLLCFYSQYSQGFFTRTNQVAPIESIESSNQVDAILSMYRSQRPGYPLGVMIQTVTYNSGSTTSSYAASLPINNPLYQLILSVRGHNPFFESYRISFYTPSENLTSQEPHQENSFNLSHQEKIFDESIERLHRSISSQYRQRPIPQGYVQRFLAFIGNCTTPCS